MLITKEVYNLYIAANTILQWQFEAHNVNMTSVKVLDDSLINLLISSDSVREY